MNRQDRTEGQIRLQAKVMPLRKINFSRFNQHLPIRIIFLALTTVVLVFSYAVNPEGFNIVKCSFYNLTGYPCLTCGLTRSFHAMAHAEIGSAFHYHLIGPFLFMAILLFAVKNLLEIFLGRRIRLKLPPGFFRKSLLLLGMLWIVYWIFRLLKQ
jgi:hypothetical protein